MNAAVACFHVVQVLFVAACMAFLVMTLYQISVPIWFLAAVYGVYAFQPHNIVYSVTLWKDIPFAAATVLFVTSLYRLVKGIGKSKRLNYITFVIGALGFSLWRTNKHPINKNSPFARQSLCRVYTHRRAHGIHDVSPSFCYC